MPRWFDLYTLGECVPLGASIKKGNSEFIQIWEGRQHLSDYPLSESTVNIMKGWIQECLNSHVECNHTLMGEGSPTRLIDVEPKDGSKDPFLIEVGEMLLIGQSALSSRLPASRPKWARNCLRVMGQLSELSDSHIMGKARTDPRRGGTWTSLRYETLSHCWGGTQHLQSTTATKNNREKKSIMLSSMSPTFRDTVSVTRSLGLQYF